MPQSGEGRDWEPTSGARPHGAKKGALALPTLTGSVGLRMSTTSRRWPRNSSHRSQGVGGLVIGGDYQGLGIARSLGRRGVPVCVIDDEASIARVSRFSTRAIHVPSLKDEPSTLDTLDAARRAHGLEGWVLVPTREETVASLARNRAWLAQSFRVPTPDWETIRHAWDKRETYRLAQTLGIPI